MAHTKSARKRIRQDKKRHERNQAEKSRVRTLTKKLRTALGGTDAEAVPAALKTASRALDRAASKGVIPRKTASRKISRLARAAHRKAAATSAPASS